jgi:hypothetical protein
MKALRVVRRLVAAVLACWFAGCLLAFFSGFLLALLPIPWGLPLPWSGFNDFAETTDGRVFVSSRFYNRALCYDRSGRFLYANRFPRGAHDARLAAGKDGLLYCRGRDAVYAYSSDWELLSVARVDPREERVWELDRDGPAHAPHRLGEARPDRPVGPGDLLFSEEEGREEFRCADGSTLRRVGNDLERVSPEGEVIATYGTPWPLRPFVYPYPAFIAWCGFFLLGVLGGFRARGAAAPPGKPSA